MEKTSIGENVERGAHVHCWWDCKWVPLLWKTVWTLLKNLKGKLPYGPAILPLGIYVKKLKTLIQKEMRNVVHCSSIYTAQHGSTARVGRQVHG